MALWDARERLFLLARARLGIRPLFHTVVDGALLFACGDEEIVAGMPAAVYFAQQPMLITGQRLRWAELLGRVFVIDVFECPRCRSRMQRIAWMTDKDRESAEAERP